MKNRVMTLLALAGVSQLSFGDLDIPRSVFRVEQMEEAKDGKVHFLLKNGKSVCSQISKLSQASQAQAQRVEVSAPEASFQHRWTPG